MPMSSKIPGRQINTPSPISGSSADDSVYYDRGLLDRSLIGSVVLRSSGPTPPKLRDDGGVEKVKVYARIRPALRDDETPGALVWSEETGQLTIFRPEAPVPHSDFVFEKVLGPTSSQADVYSTAVSEVVADVLRGYNGTILAYGQTGAGKTYTLGNTAPDAIGMIPRAAAELFSAAARDHVNMYSITMSYIQIYMEMIQDLLNPTADNLPIREDANGVFVAGACEVPVASLEECLHYLELGEQNRVFAFTHLNAHSSRSHAVVMLTAVKSRKYLTSEERAQAEAPDQDGVVTQRVTVGKLYMVDLAGSERLKKSKSVGLRATEARSINLSLTTLGMCISARAQDSPHVPFRDSKLTRLLQESLGGNAKTSLILCLSDVRQHADESLQSLQFGARAACVRNKPVVNERLQMRQLTAELLAALEENHERADGLEAALSQTKEERDMLQAALAREKAHTAKIVDALRAEARAKEEQAAKLAAQAELLSEHVQQLGQVQQQQGQLEMEMEQLKRQHKSREEAHQLEVAALQEKLAAAKAAAEEAAAAAEAEREALKAEARSQQAQLAAAAQQQTSALATRLAQERAASRDQAAAIHLALTRLQRALGELVSGPSYTYAPSYGPPTPPPQTPSQGGGPPEAEASDVVATRRVPPPSEAGTAPLPPPRERYSSGGSSSSSGGVGGLAGGADGGTGDGWGSAASSIRGRSEGSYGVGGGGSGGGASASAAVGADASVSRRAQWMASLAAAVASRRGVSTGSAGAGAAPVGTPGSLAGASGGGESSGGGSAVQLIKQALGMESAGADAGTDADGVLLEDEDGAEGQVKGLSEAASGGPVVGAVAHLQFDLPLVASGTAGAGAGAGAGGAGSAADKPFISPPCSSPRSHGGATGDGLPVTPHVPTGAGAVTALPTASGAVPTTTPTELDLSDIDAALAAAQQDLLADFGGSVRAVQLVQSGLSVSGGGAGGVAALAAAAAAAAAPGASHPGHLKQHAASQRDQRPLPGGRTGGPDGSSSAGGSAGGGAAVALGDEASAGSLGPQSLTVSSSSGGGGGGYGIYGDADAGSDDGAVDSLETAAAAAASAGGDGTLGTPFMRTTAQGAAAAGTDGGNPAVEGQGPTVTLVFPAHLIPPGGAGGAAATAGVTRRTSGGPAAGLRAGSGTLNLNPAFDTADSSEVHMDIGIGAAGAASGSDQPPHPYFATGAARLRGYLGHRRTSGSNGGGGTAAPAASGGGAAAAAAAAAQCLRDSPLGGLNISDGGASDLAAGPSSEGSLTLLLPPPAAAQPPFDGTQPPSAAGTAASTAASGGGAAAGLMGGSHGGAAVTRGSALFAGIQVQLDSLLEMAGVLRRIKMGLEQRIEQQTEELVRRQDELMRLESEVGDKGTQLQASRAALAAAETELADTLSELLSVRGALDDTVSELGRTRTELAGRGEELATAQQQLGDTEGQLGETAKELEEARQEAEAGREECKRLAEELEQAQAELTSERATLRSLLAASARSKQVSTQALAARHELQRQVRAANAIKRAYKAFKLLQLRGQVAAKQQALQEASAVQRGREAAQAARAGQALVQESVSVIKDAVGSILAAFVGRRYELEARRTLLERLDKVMPPTSAGSAVAQPGGILTRRGSSPARSGGAGAAGTASASAYTAASYRKAATSGGLSAAPSMTPLRSRIGSNPVSLSMMLAAATLPLTVSPAATATGSKADGMAATAAGAMSPATSVASRPTAASPAAAGSEGRGLRIEGTPRELAASAPSGGGGSPPPQPTPAPTMPAPHTPAVAEV